MDALTAMRMARDALLESADLVRQDYESDWRHGMPTRAGQLAAKKATVDEHDKAIAALDAAIQQIERAEPVAWQERQRCQDGPWTDWYDRAMRGINQPRSIVIGHTTYEFRPLYAAPVAQPVNPPVHQPVHGWTDADADAARLALELECILTDPDQPMPSISRWWDSAHEALELHRQRMAEPPTESMDRRAATARPAPAKADLSASGPPITDDDLRAMLPDIIEKYYPNGGRWETKAVLALVELVALDLGRAIVRAAAAMGEQHE